MANLQDVNNDVSTKASILDMAMGGIKERVDYEMSRVMDNIQDINVPATKPRKLVIELEFKPDEYRQRMAVAATVKSKLIPTIAVGTTLFVAPDGNGELTYKEATLQAPGQLNFDGGQQEAPKELRLVK